MRRSVGAGGPITGEVRVPGDKSITHRALLLGACASGTGRVRGYLDGGDCRASIAAVRDLGVEVEAQGSTELVIHGRGFEGLQEAADVLDCAGSGTTMRLLAGLLAGRTMLSILTGNASLRGRPMSRIVEPLRGMGAAITGRAGGRLPPLVVQGGGLKGIEYTLPMASAQVKSCLLLAGLGAEGPTSIIEPAPTRDHTERMVAAMGASLQQANRRVTVERTGRLEPMEITVPGDLSSAAFLAAAATLVPGSFLRIRDVGVNPTRTGFLDILAAMGASVVLENRRLEAGEPVADLVVGHADLRGTVVEGDLIPLAIDELPLVAVLATQAQGRTEVREAQELRVKESDRIAALVEELQRLGADIEELPDGFVVEGPTPLKGGLVRARGDHRLAMALAVAGLVASSSVVIEDAERSEDSFPGFFELLEETRA